MGHQELFNESNRVLWKLSRCWISVTLFGVPLFKYFCLPLLELSSVEHFWFDVSGITAVAIHAFVRGVFVEHDRFVTDELGLNVAFAASHVCVAAS